MHKITVIGSLNMDLVVRSPKAPQAGETIAGTDFHMIPGGKGANQAVAASRAGANVHMVGCVGADAFGPVLLDSLHQAGVDIESVLSLTDLSTGTATIIVEDSGENRIIIVPGANGCVTSEQIDELWPEIQQSDTILLQFEIPLETVFHVIRRAKHDDMRVIVNPAPAYKIPADILAMITCLIVNEKEAAMISGQPVSDVDSAFNAAEAIHSLGVETVIVTLGAAGAILFNGTAHLHQPANKVEVVDTTAAGDTFVGSYAAALLDGKSSKEALHFATAAACLAVTRLGAQPSIPFKEKVDEFIKRNNL